MLIKTNWHSFEAILRTEGGEEIAQGEATVSLERNCVTFESDFVPLYPLGTPMEIMRLHDGEPIHRFIGKVYLSDKHLLRIVSVEDELLPGSERFYNEDISLMATLHTQPAVIPQEEQKRKRQFFTKKEPEKREEPADYTVTIAAISAERLIFQFEHAEDIRLDLREEKGFWDIMDRSGAETKAEKGERYFIEIGEGLALKTEIEVAQPFYFGQRASYACRFVSLSKKDRKKIKDFLWAHTLKHHKLF